MDFESTFKSKLDSYVLWKIHTRMTAVSDQTCNTVLIASANACSWPLIACWRQLPHQSAQFQDITIKLLTESYAKRAINSSVQFNALQIKHWLHCCFIRCLLTLQRIMRRKLILRHHHRSTQSTKALAIDTCKHNHPFETRRLEHRPPTSSHNWEV